jgi:hypothetical protein
MWEYRCKLLADVKEGLKFTKVENAIRNLYAEKDIFLNIDKGLFALPIARILAKPPAPNKRTFRACKPQKSDGKKAQTLATSLENAIIPTHRHAIQEKTKKRRKQEKPNARKTTNARRKHDDKTNARTTRPNNDVPIHRSLIHTPRRHSQNKTTHHQQHHQHT